MLILHICFDTCTVTALPLVVSVVFFCVTLFHLQLSFTSHWVCFVSFVPFLFQFKSLYFGPFFPLLTNVCSSVIAIFPPLSSSLATSECLPPQRHPLTEKRTGNEREQRDTVMGMWRWQRAIRTQWKRPGGGACMVKIMKEIKKNPPTFQVYVVSLKKKNRIQLWCCLVRRGTCFKTELNSWTTIINPNGDQTLPRQRLRSVDRKMTIEIMPRL